MNKENNGRLAYQISIHPDHGYGPVASVNQGMSMRDYFAGQALASMMGAREWYGTFEECAKKAYIVADCMLKARKKEKR